MFVSALVTVGTGTYRADLLTADEFAAWVGRLLARFAGAGARPQVTIIYSGPWPR